MYNKTKKFSKRQGAFFRTDISNLEFSEKRYRRLFESAKDGILILNFDTGIIEDINPFLLNLLQYSREELYGSKVWDISPFKDMIRNKRKFSELVKKNYVRYESLPLESKSGKLKYVEFVSNVYKVDKSKVIQCNIRDITERKRTEDKLKESLTALAQQKSSLEQKTVALAEVIAQIEIEKNKIKMNVAHNVEQVLLPLLEQLKLKKETPRNIQLLHKGLLDLTSSFGFKISKKGLNLSSREREICNLIKSKDSTKEISKLLHISPQTIEKHRKNIRRKLSLSNKPVNLAMFLQNL